MNNYGIISKVIVVCSAMLLLVACSSMRKSSHHNGKQRTTQTQEADAQSAGVGYAPNFAGQNTHDTRMMAPHNQTYYFAFDTSTVNEKDAASITVQARYLRKHPGAHIMLAGNTDERGSREYNVALGERRANSVADILLVEGVSKKQIRVVSYGEERPVALGHDEEAWRLNRRVELTYEATS